MSSQQKVIYICPNGYLGGAERFVVEAAKGHREYGQWEPVIIFFSDGAAVRRAQIDGTKYHILQTSFRLSRPLSLLRALREVRSILKREKPNTVHGTMPYGYIVTFFASLFLPLKRIWFQHGPVKGQLDFIANQLGVDVLLFNSKFLQDEHSDTARITGKVKDQEKIIRLGIADEKTDESKVVSLREKYVHPEKKLFISAGRLCSWKGFETILKAILLLPSESREQMHLLIVGDAMRETDKSYAQSLYEYVKENHLDDIVIFESFKENINDYYRAADVFIHASTIPEPFGLTVAEAMKQETFVIGSNQGGVQDILHHEKTGYSYNPCLEDSSGDLAKLIERALNNEEEVSRCINSAKENIDQRYSIKQMVQDLEALY